MLRIVQREQIVALSGPRALLMQAAHPVAFAGFFAHTGALEDPYRRLARTARVMDTVGFGSRAAADRATRRVRAMHRRVRGTLAEPAGRFPAGTPYAADDPALLLWILACLADSAWSSTSATCARSAATSATPTGRTTGSMGRLFGLRPADSPAALDGLHARHAPRRRPARQRPRPRAGQADRHEPAGAAAGPPAARAGQLHHRRPAAARAAPPVPAGLGPRARARPARRRRVHAPGARAAAAAAAAAGLLARAPPSLAWPLSLVRGARGRRPAPWPARRGARLAAGRRRARSAARRPPARRASSVSS